MKDFYWKTFIDTEEALIAIKLPLENHGWFLAKWVSQTQAPMREAGTVTEKVHIAVSLCWQQTFFCSDLDTHPRSRLAGPIMPVDTLYTRPTPTRPETQVLFSTPVVPPIKHPTAQEMVCIGCIHNA